MSLTSTPPRHAGLTLRHSLLSSVVALVACGDGLPEVVAVGDRVRIAPVEDVPVCAGSVQTFERYLAEVEARLGVQRPGPVTIYWGHEAVDLLCPSREAGFLAGCASSEERWIAADLLAAPHELAHHLEFAAGGRSIPLLSEGLAVYAEGELVLLDGGPTPLDELVENDEAGTLPAHYAVGGSLIGFIAERWGIGAALDLHERAPKGATIDDVDAASRAALGLSWMELDAIWRATVPHASSGPRFPLATRTAPLLPYSPLTLEATLDCDELSTEGPLDGSILLGDDFHADPLERGMYAHFEVVVEVPAEVELEVVGPAGTWAQLYLRGAWTYSVIDIPPPLVEVLPGEPRRMTLNGGRWQVFLVSDAPHDVVDLALHLRPVPG